VALLTRDKAKAYRRVTSSAEDALFDDFLLEGKALIERAVGTITAVSRTMYGLADPRDSFARPVEGFYLPYYPIAPDPVITNANGDTVDALTYRVDQRAGRIIGLTTSSWFGAGPYIVVVNAGWSAHPDYATQIEPLINAVLRDYVLDRYDNREPGYTSVTAGGGVSRTQVAGELPPRAALLLGRLRRIRV
jgi:phage tail protein X